MVLGAAVHGDERLKGDASMAEEEEEHTGVDEQPAEPRSAANVGKPEWLLETIPLARRSWGDTHRHVGFASSLAYVRLRQLV